MATTTYEEEKQPLQRPADLVLPTYAPPTPTAAYGDSDQAAIMQQMIADYVNRTDPQAQAEQDKKIQRGRAIWTGANLFANVIANAINASGTAKGAPSMTFNDAASQKMYDTWRDQDKELKADRKAAQQRLDALRLQDAQFRMADKQAQDKAALEAYKTQFGLDKDAAVANWNRQNKEYDMQQQQEREDAIRKENQAFQREGWDRADRRARMGGGRSGSTTTKSDTSHSVQLGSIDIPAKDEKEAQRIRRDVANKIVDRMNADIEKRNKEKKVTEPKEELIAKPKNDKEAQAIIYQSGDLYDDDADFRKDINGTYGIEDIYAEEPAVAPQPQYGMPWYQPRYGEGVYGSNPQPASTMNGVGTGLTEDELRRNDGYFLGSRSQPWNNNTQQGRNTAVYREGQKLSAYKVEGNRATIGKYDGGYVGTQRAPHELTEEEKELIKKNGEKPKINY